VTVYIDDILIYSRTLEEHLSHLKTVMTRLTHAGLKLKPSKCLLVQKEVNYLGHVNGLQVSDQHAQAVRVQKKLGSFWVYVHFTENLYHLLLD